MNRRAFLQRFGIGVSAALALASLPNAAIAALDTTQAGRRIAMEYLLGRFRDHVRVYGKPPLSIVVSPGLFEAFEGELVLIRRFTCTGEQYGLRSLMFKGRPMIPDPSYTGWNVSCVPDHTQGREYAMNTTGAVYA